MKAWISFLLVIAIAGSIASAQDRDRTSRRVEVKDPSTFAEGQDRPLFSGPQRGEPLPEFSIMRVQAGQEDQQIDPIAVAGDDPQILIFQAGTEGVRSALALTRLLPAIREQSGQPLRVTVILMDDDRNASASLAGRVLPYVGQDVLIGFTTEGRDGPGVYGLNRNVAQTILMAKDGQVTRSMAFSQGASYADPHVFGAIAEVLSVSQEQVSAWIGQAQADESMTRRRQPDQSQPRPRGEENRSRTHPRQRYPVEDPREFFQDGQRPIFSGPQPGEAIPNFELIGLQGDLKGEVFNPVVGVGDTPHMFIFSDTSGANLRGIHGMIMRVLPTIEAGLETDLRTTVSFLGEDRNALEETGRQFFARFELPSPVQAGITREGRAGPGALGLNRNVTMTITLVQGGQVTHSFAFPQGMLTPDPHVLGAIAELMGVERSKLQSRIERRVDAGQRTIQMSRGNR